MAVIDDSPALVTEYGYDAYGNVQTITESGDPGTDQDNRFTGIDYEPPAITAGRITHHPKTVTIKKDANSVMIAAQTVFTYAYKAGDAPALSSITTEQRDFSAHPRPLFSYAHFDDLGNIDTFWTGDAARAIDIDYDDLHQTYPETVTYPTSQTETYRYDPRFGLPTAVTNLTGLGTTYEYDGFGRLDFESGPGGPIDYSYEENETGLTITMSHQGATGENDDYTVIEQYNGLGQLIETTVPGGAAGTTLVTHYDYDGLGRLIKRSVPNPATGQPSNRVLQTGYDDLGNLTQLAGASFYYTDPRPHLMTADSFGRTYHYDDDGNVTTRG